MPNIFIDQKSLAEIRSIIFGLYPQAVVWAYGSRVDGDAHEGSDLDLAVKDFGQPQGDLNALREALQESNVPFLIDIFDFQRLPPSFQKEIEKKHAVL